MDHGPFCGPTKSREPGLDKSAREISRPVGRALHIFGLGGLATAVGATAADGRSIFRGAILCWATAGQQNLNASSKAPALDMYTFAGPCPENNPHPLLGLCSKQSAVQQRPNTGYGHIQRTSMARTRTILKGLLTPTFPNRENPTSHNYYP